MSSKNDHRPFQCVLFDLDGTLYDSPSYSQRLDVEIAKIVSEMLKLPEDQARSLLEERRRTLNTLTGALRSLGLDREIFFMALAKRVDPRAYLGEDLVALKAIERLRAEGFLIGLVSNSGRALVEEVLDAIGLRPEMFHVVVTSTEAEPKPSPQPFLLALSHLGIDRGRAVYVGDRDEAELRPAKELGIKTILLDRTGIKKSRWADHVVGSVADIPSIVEQTVRQTARPAA
jgi:FMN phosphatase YigB (HAD superfamily)